jgi:hypothetical protein
MLFLLKNRVEQTNDRELIALVGDIFNKVMQQEAILEQISASLEGDAEIADEALAARWAGQELNAPPTRQAEHIILGGMTARRRSVKEAEMELWFTDFPGPKELIGFAIWNLEKRGAIRQKR